MFNVFILGVPTSFGKGIYLVTKSRESLFTSELSSADVLSI